MNIVLVSQILILILCRFISGEGCKENFYHWMFKKPMDNSGQFAKLQGRWHKSNNGGKSKEGVPHLENWSQSLCHFPPASAKPAISPNCKSIANLTTDYNNSTSDITNCYHLSPQLLDCQLISYPKACYTVDPETQQLHVSKTDLRLDSGDYFVDHQDRVFLCSEPIPTPVNSPRCNYMTLNTSQFVILSNGSLYINETHKTIQRSLYEPIDQKSMNVCYPLSIEFLNCSDDLLYVIEHNQYDALPGLKIFYRTHNQIIDPSQYYHYNENKDVVVCVSSKSMRICSIMGTVCFWLESISVAFLLFTITYESLIPKKTNHRMCLLFHGLTMLFYYLSALFDKFVNGHAHFVSCYFFFFVKYFSMTSAFTWLTALAIDICSSFSALQTSYCQCGTHDRHTTLKYNLFGWGLPLVMCILVATLEFDKNLQKLLHLYPHLEASCQCFCWFNNQVAASLFHYVLDTSLATANIILYIITIYNIRHESKETTRVNYKCRRQRLVVGVKLFVIMGAPLVTEGILWNLQSYLPFYFWYITNIIVSLQGVIITSVLVFKRKAFRQLQARMNIIIYKKMGVFQIPSLTSA